MRWIAQFHEVAATAWFAFTAVTVEETDADPVAHVPGGHTRPTASTSPTISCPGTIGFDGLARIPLIREGIGVEYTARSAPAAAPHQGAVPVFALGDELETASWPVTSNAR